jgi:hypothetical protein
VGWGNEGEALVEEELGDEKIPGRRDRDRYCQPVGWEASGFLVRTRRIVGSGGLRTPPSMILCRWTVNRTRFFGGDVTPSPLGCRSRSLTNESGVDMGPGSLAWVQYGYVVEVRDTQGDPIAS